MLQRAGVEERSGSALWLAQVGAGAGPAGGKPSSTVSQGGPAEQGGHLELQAGLLAASTFLPFPLGVLSSKGAFGTQWAVL